MNGLEKTCVTNVRQRFHVMIDIITKYPDISPRTHHAISEISRTENINIFGITKVQTLSLQDETHYHLGEFFLAMNVK